MKVSEVTGTEIACRKPAGGDQKADHNSRRNLPRRAAERLMRESKDDKRRANCHRAGESRRRTVQADARQPSRQRGDGRGRL
jgi:hypothetical protein